MIPHHPASISLCSLYTSDPLESHRINHLMLTKLTKKKGSPQTETLSFLVRFSIAHIESATQRPQSTNSLCDIQPSSLPHWSSVLYFLFLSSCMGTPYMDLAFESHRRKQYILEMPSTFPIVHNHRGQQGSSFSFCAAIAHVLNDQIF